MFNEFNTYGATPPSYLNDVPPAIALLNKELLKNASRAGTRTLTPEQLKAMVQAQKAKIVPKKSALGWYYSGLKAKILIPTAIGLHAYRNRNTAGKIKYAQSIGAGVVYMPYLLFIIGQAAYGEIKKLRK